LPQTDVLHQTLDWFFEQRNGQQGGSMTIEEGASVYGLRAEFLSDPANPQATTVKVAGEIDASNANVLREALEMACEPGRRIVVDMEAVSFIDASGVNALVAVANRAGDAHQGLSIQLPSPNVRKILGILGLSQYFGIDGQIEATGVTRRLQHFRATA
jgi:anti-anti-sigma factor